MKLSSKEKSFLDKVVKRTWSINTDTGLVDVDGSVDMSNRFLTEIPVKFGNVTGDFYCYKNKLTSLVGAPQSVGGSFICFLNQLVNLEGAPKSVCGHFDCSNNKLTSLLGCPQYIKKDFICSRNQLNNLEGAPQSVLGSFHCSNNQLTSLLNSPKSVVGDFICYNNQLVSLEGFPESLGGFFHIDLSYIKQDYYHVIIPQIEEMMERGIELLKKDEYYYPYKEAYYNDKIIELL